MDYGDNMKNLKSVKAGFTVEAAGVTSAVLISFLVLIRAAIVQSNQIKETMELHQQVEVERHQIETGLSETVTKDFITSSAFRPEQYLRLWSLFEEVVE